MASPEKVAARPMFEGHREMSAPAALYAVSLPAVDRGSEEMLTGI
jgi:hypothetical protein